VLGHRFGAIPAPGSTRSSALHRAPLRGHAAANTTARKRTRKQRVGEIRVSSILKLDRAEKSAPEDQDHDEATQEEAAA